MSQVHYEIRKNVAVLTLNRPEQANAQSAVMLEELDSAFDRAVSDETVRVIVLKANGKHFSAGHDLGADARENEPWKSMHADVPNTGLLRMYNWEAKHFYGYSQKWRDLPKPTIAAVQGACIAAGLMLAWPCDLIVAADDAWFSDPVLHMGICGVEYQAHAWEFGPRKAKELLFTAGVIDAHEAHRLGMVNRVVPPASLEEATLALADQIAQMPPHALMLAKRAVNQALDAQGQQVALRAAFDLHSLGHANAWVKTGGAPAGSLDTMKESNRSARLQAKAGSQEGTRAVAIGA